MQINEHQRTDKKSNVPFLLTNYANITYWTTTTKMNDNVNDHFQTTTIPWFSKIFTTLHSVPDIKKDENSATTVISVQNALTTFTPSNTVSKSARPPAFTDFPSTRTNQILEVSKTDSTNNSKPFRITSSTNEQSTRTRLTVYHELSTTQPKVTLDDYIDISARTTTELPFITMDTSADWIETAVLFRGKEESDSTVTTTLTQEILTPVSPVSNIVTQSPNVFKIEMSSTSSSFINQQSTDASSNIDKTMLFETNAHSPPSEIFWPTTHSIEYSSIENTVTPIISHNLTRTTTLSFGRQRTLSDFDGEDRITHSKNYNHDYMSEAVDSFAYDLEGLLSEPSSNTFKFENYTDISANQKSLLPNITGNTTTSDRANLKLTVTVPLETITDKQTKAITMHLFSNDGTTEDLTAERITTEKDINETFSNERTVTFGEKATLNTVTVEPLVISAGTSNKHNFSESVSDKRFDENNARITVSPTVEFFRSWTTTAIPVTAGHFATLSRSSKSTTTIPSVTLLSHDKNNSIFSVFSESVIPDDVNPNKTTVPLEFNVTLASTTAVEARRIRVFDPRHKYTLFDEVPDDTSTFPSEVTQNDDTDLAHFAPRSADSAELSITGFRIPDTEKAENNENIYSAEMPELDPSDIVDVDLDKTNEFLQNALYPFKNREINYTYFRDAKIAQLDALRKELNTSEGVTRLIPPVAGATFIQSNLLFPTSTLKPEIKKHTKISFSVDEIPKIMKLGEEFKTKETNFGDANEAELTESSSNQSVPLESIHSKPNQLLSNNESGHDQSLTRQAEQTQLKTNQVDLNHSKPDQAELQSQPSHTKENQAESNQSMPDQYKANQSTPDQLEQDQSGQDQAVTAQAESIQSETDQTELNQSEQPNQPVQNQSESVSSLNNMNNETVKNLNITSIRESEDIEPIIEETALYKIGPRISTHKTALVLQRKTADQPLVNSAFSIDDSDLERWHLNAAIQPEKEFAPHVTDSLQQDTVAIPFLQESMQSKSKSSSENIEQTSPNSKLRSRSHGKAENLLSATVSLPRSTFIDAIFEQINSDSTMPTLPFLSDISHNNHGFIENSAELSEPQENVK